MSTYKVKRNVFMIIQIICSCIWEIFVAAFALMCKHFGISKLVYLDGLKGCKWFAAKCSKSKLMMSPMVYIINFYWALLGAGDGGEHDKVLAVMDILFYNGRQK